MKRVISVIGIFFFFFSIALGQKGKSNQHKEILLNPSEETFTTEKGKFQQRLGIPLVAYDLNFRTEGDTPLQRAEHFLETNRKTYLRSTQPLENLLKLIKVWETRNATIVRFQQIVANIPVYEANLTVTLNAKNEVIFVDNGYKPDIVNSPKISYQKLGSLGRSIVSTYLNESPDQITSTETLELFYQQGKVIPVHRIEAYSQNKSGEWEFLIDANRNEILQAKNKSLSLSDEKKPPTQKRFFTGTGYIFDPDPLATASKKYGDNGFTDAGDANTPELEAQLIEVTLNDIEQIDTKYYLQGPYAEIVDFRAPFTGIFEQSSPNFLFNRSDDAFEAVNAYYHIDKAMRYVNEDLGLEVKPFRPGVTRLRIDPHGEGNEDSSHYYANSTLLTFGDGNVDDAEDADVLWHELGHAIHDFVTNGNISNGIEGVSEGFSDYWAQSYSRSLNQWQPTDPEYHQVYNWDGHNEFWAGRTTNYEVLYPSFQGSIHINGQIFATCLMKGWDQFGRTKMDTAAILGIAMTNSTASQEDVINAIFQFAKTNWDEADWTNLHGIFSSCGYHLPSIALDLSLSTNQYIVRPGDTIAYTLRVENNSQSSLENASVSIPLPAGVSYQENNSTCGFVLNDNKLTQQIAMIASGEFQTCSFQLTNQLDGSDVFFYDTVENGNVYMEATNGNGNYDWLITSGNAVSGQNAWFGLNASNVSDQYLTTRNFLPTLSGSPALIFWHKYDLELGFDGGVVEYSTNGTNWFDMEELFTQNGYNAQITDNSAYESPILNRRAFSGSTNNEFIKTTASLETLNGQRIKIRFRLGSDSNTSRTGWFVDDIAVITPLTIDLQPCLIASDATVLQCQENSVTVIKNEVVQNENDSPDLPQIFGIYPNPISTTAKLEISLPKQEFIEIKVVDILGRVVRNDSIQGKGKLTYLFDRLDLSSGVYFLEIKGNAFNDVQKIIVAD